MGQFCALHNHTDHSLLDGWQNTDALAKRAAELGMPAVSLTDHGTMSGLVSFTKSCHANDIKPIMGMEAYCTGIGRSRTERVNYNSVTREYKGKPGFEKTNYHLILLAKSEEGYRNLCALTTESSKTGYYYKPRIDYQLLHEHKEGLVVSSACCLGEISSRLLNNDYDNAKKVAQWFQNEFGEDYYMEVMNHGLDIELATMKPIRDLADELGIKTIVTNDDHYTYREECKLQRTMMLIARHKSWQDSDVQGSFYDDYSKGSDVSESTEDSENFDPFLNTSPELYLKDYDEMVEANVVNGGENGRVQQELANTLEIADKCNYSIPFIDEDDVTQYFLPKYDIKTDVLYDEYNKSGYETPDYINDAIVDSLKENGHDEVNNVSDFLDEHDTEALNFMMWKCSVNMKRLVEPKIEAKGEPLPMSYWIDNPPEGFKVNHAHNSPDELWIKKQIKNGMTKEDILQIYRNRLATEIGIIIPKMFINYFLIVQSYTGYTRENGASVGPGRGSGAGSLLNYLLGITAVDPISTNLLFFRFISPRRLGFPDIDLDFSGEWRDNHLWPHLRNIYGKERTAGVAAYNMYWGKAAVKAAARVLFDCSNDKNSSSERRREGKNESVALSNAICGLIDNAPKLDLNNELTDALDADGKPLGNTLLKQLVGSDRRYQQIIDLALKLQGHIANDGVHASAYIISDHPITNTLPLTVSRDERNESQATGREVDNFIIQYDGREVQDQLGYVKLDLLCINDLEVITTALSMIERVYGCKIDIENIPLDDKDAFTMVANGHNTGIFQFDGSPVAIRILQDSHADRITDWSAVSALNRPGPLMLGYDKQFIQGKLHPESIHYFTPAAEKYLSETYGTACMQEEIMQLSQDPEIIGLSAVEADKLRKVTAHKQHDKVLEMVKYMHEVAKKNNVPDEVANDFCDIAVASGSYSFNKCLTGDTVVRHGTSDVSLDDVYEMFHPDGDARSVRKDDFYVIGRSADGRCHEVRMRDITMNGMRQCYEISLADGKHVKATGNHRFLSDGERYVHVDDLSVGDSLVTCDIADGTTCDGRLTSTSMIVSIEPCGSEMTYDVEIDSDEHNFFANGICSHNSHSFAYALISMRGAFLKCHFTECYLASLAQLKPQMKGKDKIPDYLSEAQSMGVKVVPPHVNYSQVKFDVPEKHVIAYGLDRIKGVGAAADVIVAERERGGRFTDMTDFCCRVPKTVTKSALSALISAGALDDLGWTRRALESSVDDIAEFRKSWFKEQSERDKHFDESKLSVDDGMAALFGSVPAATAVPARQPQQATPTFGAGQASGSTISQGACGQRLASGAVATSVDAFYHDGRHHNDHGIILPPPFDTEYTQRELLRKEYDAFGMYFSGSPEDYTQVSRRYVDDGLRASHKASEKRGEPSEYRLVNLSEVASLPDRTKVELTARIENVLPKHGGTRGYRMFKSGKGATLFLIDWGINEEGRFGFSPTQYRIGLTCFERVWGNMTHPRPDDIVHITGRVSISDDFPTSILCDTCEVLPQDSEFSRGKEELAAKLQKEIVDEKALMSDPESSAYMIPKLEFRDDESLEYFDNDDVMHRNYDDPYGNVLLVVHGDDDGLHDKVLHLKQTRGMVRYAMSEHHAIVTKTRLPKAQSEVDRRF